MSIKQFFLKIMKEFLIQQDVCEWTHVVNQMYQMSCNKFWDLKEQVKEAYKYCPSCGKKVSFK